MLKGLEMNGSRAAAGKTAVAAGAPVRSPLLRARVPASKRPQAFRSPVVKVQASAEPSAAQTQGRARDNKLPLEQVTVGAEYEGRVVKVEAFGAFVDFGFAKQGLVHISQLSDKYIKNAASVVSQGQTVKVKVMSVDAAAGRIALSMKGTSAAAASRDAEESVDEAEVEDVEEAEAFDEEDEEDGELLIEAPEGYEFVSAAEEPEVTFLMAEDDEEMTFESVAAFEALAPEQIDREVILERMPVPVGDVITGKVTRVEDFGAFVEFTSGGRTYTALLERDEAKVPSSALSAEQLAQATGGEEGAAPAFVEWDIENMAKFYPVGQEVTAFVLEYNDKNQMSLTQFADWELQAAVAELEGQDEEQALEILAQGDLEPLAEDPLDLLAEAGADLDAAEAAMAAEDEALSGTVEQGLRSEFASMGGLLSRPLTNQDMLTFPSRPLNRVNTLALNARGLGLTETDFDNDEVTLEDYWTETFVVPKGAIKRMGLKFNVNEAGEPELVDKEGADKGEWNIQRALRKGHNARVKEFVQDILAADEDEAELPARAMRRPVVLAAAVQNISAATVKSLRDKTGAGMMDCKKALAENDGDVEKSIEVPATL